MKDYAHYKSVIHEFLLPLILAGLTLALNKFISTWRHFFTLISFIILFCYLYDSYSCISVILGFRDHEPNLKSIYVAIDILTLLYIGDVLLHRPLPLWVKRASIFLLIYLFFATFRDIDDAKFPFFDKYYYQLGLIVDLLIIGFTAFSEQELLKRLFTNR